MEIRAVTLFAEPTFNLAKANDFFRAAREAFHVPVQTTRVALTPLATWWDPGQFPVIQARKTAEQWQSAGAEFISLGPVQLRHDAGWLDKIPEIIASSDVLFAGAEVADGAGHIDVGRCSAVAEVILRLGTLKGGGLGNMYFAALANCPPGSPYFPVAYHRGGSAQFALAVEAAELARSAIEGVNTLAEAQQNLVEAIERKAAALSEDAKALATAHDLFFAGIDFSLAPKPSEVTSLGAALEDLGLSHLGAPGSLFAAAFIAAAIDRAEFQRCGFSGLMLPVLGDTVVSARAAEGRLNVNDLLSYAAVCGVGLDEVPLPGDVSQSALAGILLDLAALAVRLDKPLTARLLPVPGLKAGDPVRLDFPDSAEGRVMHLSGPGVSGKLTKSTRVYLNSISGDGNAGPYAG